LLDPHDDADVPRVTAWLQYAEAALHLMRALVAEAPEHERLRRACELNVVSQLVNARTYPEIAAAIALGRLKLHGWYYDIAAGEVTTHGAQLNRFVPLSG
jgi:carbonic anhydrase